MAKIDLTLLDENAMYYAILENKALYELLMRSVFSNNIKLIVDRLEQLYKFRADQLETVNVNYYIIMFNF
jgi:hypothetical protein